MGFATLRQTMTLITAWELTMSRAATRPRAICLTWAGAKIAHISGPEFWQSSQERVQGYRQALDEYGLPYDASLVETGDWEIAGGVAALDRLLDRRPDIEAVFASNDLMAAGCIQAATRRRLRIPDDLALVSYDDRRLAEALNPPLTSLLPLTDRTEGGAPAV